MTRIFLLICWQTGLLCISMKSAAQNQADTIAIGKYLETHYQLIDLKKTKKIALFDSAFYQHAVFLFGETHGSALPQQADLFLFKHLYYHAGVRSYIAEVDDTKAWMLNNYVQDGDTAWLRKVFSSWVADTTQWGNREYYQKFVELRSFYQGLPASGKFRILGIDLAQDYTLLRQHLAWLMSLNAPSAKSIYLDSLKQMLDTITDAGAASLAQFSHRVLDATSTNVRLLGTNGRNNRQVMHLLRSFSYVKTGVTRDSVLYQNFRDIVRNGDPPTGAYYGFLGFYHCLMTSYAGRLPFAALVNGEGSKVDRDEERDDDRGAGHDDGQYGDPYDNDLAGKVTSIEMMSLDSKCMLPLTAGLRKMMPSFMIDQSLKTRPGYGSGRYMAFDMSNDNQLMFVRGIRQLRARSKPHSFTLFRLDGQDSPYNRSKELGEVNGIQTIRITRADAVTTDAFQYVLLIRDSGPGTPLIFAP